MRKETVITSALLLALAVAAFVMAGLQHEELLSREVLEGLAGRQPLPIALPLSAPTASPSADRQTAVIFAP